MLPINDEGRALFNTPYVTIGLIIINTVVFLFLLLFIDIYGSILKTFGLIPAYAFSGMHILTFISSMFLHGGITHLLSNMWFLWIFGNNVEDNLGKTKFLALYLVSGVCGSLFYIFLSNTNPNIPLIGASGAISGIMGAYLIMFPKNKITVMYRSYFGVNTPSLSCYVYILIWFLIQFISMGVERPVAYAAHIGGFISGLLISALLRKKMVFTDFIAGQSYTREEY